MLTLKDAKKIYLKYDCFLFALAREEPNLYNEYKSLNVSGIMNMIYIPHLKWGPRQSRSVT